MRKWFLKSPADERHYAVLKLEDPGDPYMRGMTLNVDTNLRAEMYIRALNAVEITLPQENLCQGACTEHLGLVRRYELCGTSWPQKVDYCDVAIAEAQLAGYPIKEL